MADVTIDSSAHANLHLYQQPAAGICWRSITVGYLFYLDSDTDYKYIKTTTGGTSWSGTTKVMDGDFGMSFGLWCDWWTEGDTGTKIHFVGYDEVNTGFYYRNLDTASDTLSTAVEVANLFGNADGGWGASGAIITKARGGNLYANFNAAASGDNTNFYRSVDGGVNWTVRTDIPAFSELMKLVPAYTGDTQDVALIVPIAADATYIYIYDDSANTWSSAVSCDAASPGTFDVDHPPFDAVVSFAIDAVFVARWNAYDVGTADLLFNEVSLGATPVRTSRTNVLTDSAESARVAIEVNQITGAIRVYYIRGATFGTTCSVYYKESSDRGATWGSEVEAMETADTAIMSIFSSQSVGGNGVSGRHQICWFNNTLDDILTSVVNGADVTVSAAAMLPRSLNVNQAVARAASW